MRWLLLVILLLPSASAASQVHLTYTGDGYAVTYRGPETTVATPNATYAATDVGGGWKRAEVPLGGGAPSYTVGGRTFPLAPPPAPHASTRIVYVADMGVTENSSRIAHAIANASPDLVLIGGDLAYAHADLAMWNDWFDLVEPFAAKAPLMPAFGNHEHYCQRDAATVERCEEESARWDQHFALPNGEKRFYAFDWGPLRVTTLDTEAYIDAEGERATEPDEQERFLRDSLDADADRWDIVMFHRPLRTTLLRDGAALPSHHAARLQELLGASDLTLQAHVHAYERSRPDANGTIHVTSGGGGRELYDTWGPEQEWLAARAAVHHFVVLDVSPGRIAARTLGIDGEEIDAFTMEREVPASLRPPAATPPPSATSTPMPTTTTGPGATPPSQAPSQAPPTRASTQAPGPDGLAETTPDPTESRGAPIPSWTAAVAVACALALTASRRRRARRARG